MSVFRSLVIAFSLYSKIPMPHMEWRDEDMRWVMIFFPLIGVVIGIAMCLWQRICIAIGIGNMARSLVLAAIPVIITGGFHVDGFMDTMDALHSYAPRERKLEILKDSHVGAFAVIMAVLWSTIYIAGLSEIGSVDVCITLSGGFVVSRILSALAVIRWPKANADGNVEFMARTSESKIVIIILLAELIIMALFLLGRGFSAIVVIIGAAGSYAYYYYKCRKEFGGTSGDLAGWFVVICEVSITVLMAVFVNIMRIL